MDLPQENEKLCRDNSTSLALCHGQTIQVVVDSFDEVIKLIGFDNKIICSIFRVLDTGLREGRIQNDFDETSIGIAFKPETNVPTIEVT